ncbi:hypothetical protein B0O99DRAFT_719784 [Bisporella sp. PMI_857]|nr:hypothetical protein B0O99DRAFT_719784 [Bisporella sp. PMI_857]
MYISNICLIALLSFVAPHVAADPQESEELAKRFGIFGRKEDLSFCFGRNSICETSNNLYTQCKRFQDDYDNLKPWYECLCGNGYVSVDEACDWCQEVYQLGGSSYNMRDDCVENGASIAAIPTAILAQQSSYNATYTGIISGAGSAPTGSASVTITRADSSTTKASATSGPKSTNAPSSSTSGSGSRATAALTINGGGDFPFSTITDSVATSSSTLQDQTWGWQGCTLL